MNDKFDELAKNLAQSVTRRGAMKKFGVGFASIALASLGMTDSAQAGGCKPSGSRCNKDFQCCSRCCDFSDDPANHRFCR